MRLATLAALSILLAPPSFSVKARNLDWADNPGPTLRAARKSGRAVFVKVGAEWCTECARMERTTFRDPEVIEALGALVTLAVDGDRDPGFVRRYGVTGYPTSILIDGKGREVARQKGYLDAVGLRALVTSIVEGPDAGCDLAGHVHDVRGAPAAAELTLSPSGASTVTAGDGSYCLRGIAAGRHELLVVADSGGAQRLTVDVGPDEGPTHQDVVVVPSREETVVVTGTRTAKLLREAPVRTEVVSRERIEQTQARTVADAVEFTPGVRVESNCQSCNFSQVRMLGLEGAYSQILIDGQAQWSPLSMVYGIEQIPTRLIENLEIVKGGGSTLYGAGAVGGIINVRPRRPTASGGTLELRGERMGGAEGHSLNGAADWVSRDGRSFVSLIGQDDATPAVDLSGDGLTEIARRELTSATLRAEHRLLNGRGRLDADLSRYEAERRGGNRLDVPPDRSDLAEWIRTDRTGLSLRWTHEPSATFDYHVATSWVETDRDTYYGAERDPGAYGTSENPLLLVETQLNHRSGAHTVSWGAQYTADSVTDRQPAIGRQLDERYTNAGLFVQDDWTIGPRASLVFGARVDKHSEIANPIFLPRAALRLAPRDDLTLRSSVSTGFRPPAVFDEDLHIELAGGAQRSVVLDPDLSEEKSLSLMQGLEWLPRRGEAFWLVEANAFRTGIRDVFEQEQLATNLFVKTNAGRARVYGLELGLGYDLPRLFTVELGWVVQRSRFDEPETDFGSRDFFRTPESYGVANFTLRSPRWGQAFLGVRYTGPMRVPRYFFDEQGDPAGQALVRSESFLTLDASVSRRFRVGRDRQAMTVTLGARNLTDAYQSDIDQGIYRDSDYVYGPRFPRAVYLTARFDL